LAVKTNQPTTSHPAGASVSFGPGQGGLARLDVLTPWSRAEIYTHGAQVTHFQKHGEPPLVFLSEASRFEPGQPIRGGIPLVFPWFGPREGLPAHGFARLSEWLLDRVALTPDGACRLEFRLPRLREWTAERPYAAEYHVTVGADLRLDLRVVNESPRLPFEFEACLHTYFTIGDIHAVRVGGLQGAHYLDALENHASRKATAEFISISAEVDRLYVGTDAAVTIHDPSLKRRILVTKEGGRSTVVWNPWIAKAKRLSDFGDEEYQHMLCVESGTIGPDRIELPPGGEHTLRVTLASAPA
jgi:glucose-6-phosphate 1-epimerase